MHNNFMTALLGFISRLPWADIFQGRGFHININENLQYRGCDDGSCGGEQ
jgi:hypothetical protein